MQEKKRKEEEEEREVPMYPGPHSPPPASSEPMTGRAKEQEPQPVAPGTSRGHLYALALGQRQEKPGGEERALCVPLLLETLACSRDLRILGIRSHLSFPKGESWVLGPRPLLVPTSC